jgi:anti-sigma regulatory factor (Ser/Thr protein kinase)
VRRSSHDGLLTLARRTFAAHQHLQRLRQLVAKAARRVGLDLDRGNDLALAVSEAAANVIKHSGTVGRLELIQDDNRALIAQITDHGPGMGSAGQPTLPSADHDSGRGLYLMHQLCDRVEHQSSPHGTTVRLEINLKYTDPPQRASQSTSIDQP